MKKYLYIFVFLASFLFIADNARAEVPFHNKDLDYKCPKGFQWSRDTVGCEQADCPAGAGRTYGLDCSCGEAWDKPFRTCYDPNTPGLATSCVAKGAECPGDKKDKSKECSLFKRAISWILPFESFKKAVGANECTAPSSSVTKDDTPGSSASPLETIYDAEREITDVWYQRFGMERRVVEVTLSNGRTIKVGIFPTGYTKPDPDNPGKYIPEVVYTSDGYNFYDKPDKVLNPSWWQRMWASSKPSLEDQISRVAKDIYNDKYNYGKKDRSRANTWIERGSFDKLLREYIKRRDEGKTPAQILNPDSEFLDLVAVKSQNPYADLIKDKYLFEAGYQTIQGFNAFGK